MHRREFVASLVAGAGLTGCTGGPFESGDGTSTAGPDPPTADRGPASETAPSAASATTSTAVGEQASVSLWSAYRYTVETDAIRVDVPESDQFAFVRPPPHSPAPAPDAFALELGGERFTPMSMEGREHAWMPGLENGLDGVYFDHEPYGESRSGALVFDVPTVETETGALVHDGTRYPLPEDRLQRFTSVPDFNLESVTVPESVALDEDVVVTVEVSNHGDRAGTFLAGFRRGGYPKPVDISAEPGETRTQTTTYDARDNSGSDVVFSYPGGRDRYEVAIEGTDRVLRRLGA